MTISRGLLLMLLLNVLVVGGGVAATYFMLKPSLAGNDDAGQRAEQAVGAAYPVRYEFFPIEKIIVSLQDGRRERYFVLDLTLMTEARTEGKEAAAPSFANVEPIVRNAVVAYLSSLQFDELRSLAIPELQTRLEKVLRETVRTRNVDLPFQQVLVSKLLVQ